MKLGEILVQLGQITPDQLDAGLGAQKLTGGKLGTNLVELGFIGTDQLSLALSRQMGVPAALERHFTRADPAVVAMLTPSLAKRYMAVPLASARNGVKQIAAAMAAPLDVLTVDDLSFALGARVEPLVASEIVIVHNIKRLYGVEVNLKTRDSLGMPAQTPGAVLIKGPVTPKPSTPTPAARSASTRNSASERTTGMKHAMSPVPNPLPASEPVLPTTLSQPRVRQSNPGPGLSLEDAIPRLTLARHREELADVVMDFMRGYFGCGIIFLVRDGQARAWRGFAPGVREAAIETIAFPLAIPSCFQFAHDNHTSLRGAAPAEGGRLQRQIWKYLHCEEPSEIIVVPVQVKSRALNLVYAHAADGGPLPDGPVTDLQALCAALSSAYVRMIQKLKAGDLAASALGR
jgi:Type II secretion system (T2SS), protein E, N-terminal domain